MKSFKEYLSEIFRPVRTYTTSDPKHPDIKIDGDNHVLYKHKFVDALGQWIPEKDITTQFVKSRDPDRLGRHLPNTWDVAFDVGGQTQIHSTKNFPTDVAKKVFDHFTHFVHTTRQITGESPIIQYETPHPKKHRIYQAAAKRLGVSATNFEKLNPDLDVNDTKAWREAIDISR